MSHHAPNAATAPTDFLLAQLTWPAAAGGPRDVMARAGAAISRLPPGAPALRLVRGARAVQPPTIYLYYALDQRASLAPQDARPLEQALAAAFAGEAVQVAVSRLEKVFERAGHSSGQACAAHYVVEMDPQEGWMPEISAWYDQEHMPGLAAVPGCAHAQRMLNHDHGPLSLACYDLVTEAALNSPPWLAVRATAWSDIARPHFTNTKRTMFQRLPDAPPDR